MYFNFDDSRPDTPRLARSLTRLEQVLLTLLGYALLVILALLAPHLPIVQEMEARQKEALEAEKQRQEDDLRSRAQFVFVQPKVDIETKIPPKLAELADKNRKSRTIERAPNPTNPLPFSRGNSADRVIADNVGKERNQPAEQPAQPAKGTENGTEGQQPDPNAYPLPSSPRGAYARNNTQSPMGSASGVISNAIRNVERYSQGESLQNVQGNGDFGPSIQFDTKGVDFGWWLRRFIAQIKRNWFVPYAAMSLRGHVVLQFMVHKDGSISDLTVAQPSAIDAFTKSAFNAIKLSNPTTPLPAEYPDEKAQFTVTFYFNETPPGGGQ